MGQIPLYLSNNFIEWGIENNVPITQLKLQKLLYLYYARYCYKRNARPFDDCFVKWPYGPVLTGVYEQLKRFQAEPLRPLHDVADGKVTRIAPSDEPFRSIFNDVVTRYGKLTASELVKLTHAGPDGLAYDTAWKKTQEMGSPLAASDIQEDGRVFFDV